jgi:hypothetical protein
MVDIPAVAVVVVVSRHHPLIFHRSTVVAFKPNAMVTLVVL